MASREDAHRDRLLTEGTSIQPLSGLAGSWPLSAPANPRLGDQRGHRPQMHPLRTSKRRSNIMNENYEYADASEYESSEWQGESGYESYPDYSESGWGEARRGRPQPVRTAPGKTAFQPRPTGTAAPVTQAQLQAALARVSQQIGVNSTAIKTIDGRVRGVVEEQGKLGAFVRKENADRKKDLELVRRDLQSTRELSALIPMITANATGPIATLAPLLHLMPGDVLGGGGSTTSGTSSSSGSMLGGSNLLAIAAIALASGAFH
jgi:hypothetical protein